MIELVIENYCYDCKDFEAEDVRNVVGDHMIMCAKHKECYAKRQNVCSQCIKDLWVDRR